MKKILVAACSATVFLFACNSGEKDKVVATDTKMEAIKKDSPATAAPAPLMDSAAMMKAWSEFKTPGPMHKWLASQTGTWEGEVSQWMDASAPPTKSKTTIVNTMTFNGLFQQSRFMGSMMGMPFEGHSITGYDNGKKMFVSTWIDNSSSGMVYMTGNWDEGTKTFSLKGKQTDPMTGKDCDIREELKVIDDNTQTMTMYGTGMDGKEMKFMEGTFTRKK